MIPASMRATTTCTHTFPLHPAGNLGPQSQERNNKNTIPKLANTQHRKRGKFIRFIQYTHRLTFSCVNFSSRNSIDMVHRMPAERHGQDHYHRDCPQTRYQTQSTSGRRGGNKSSRSYSDVLTNRDHRYKDGNRAGCGKKKPELKQSRYEVPTHNRFAGLSDMYQGNY